CFVAEKLPPICVVIENSEDANQFAVIECDANLLRLKIDTTRIKALKDDVNAALIVSRLVLPYYGGVNDAVVQPAAIFEIKLFVPLPYKTLLDIGEPILDTVNNPIVKRLKGVETLMSVEH